LTVRGTSFEPRNIANKQEIKNIEKVDVGAILDKADNKANFTQFIKNELAVSDKPELNAAKIVVSGGRGLKSKENFEILDKLANVKNSKQIIL
jgi:electron transfer flavoprotein alpha subunit